MSRSSRAAALATGLVVAAATALVPATASAAPGPVAPVLPIVAPVLDIVFAESDLKKEARVERAPRRTTVTLDSTVLFARDSPRISTKARGRLADVAGQLKKSGPGRFTITGYTDDLGSAAHGLTLSRQRAAAVADVLRDDLPKADYPFTTQGRAEADPAVPNPSSATARSTGAW